MVTARGDLGGAPGRGRGAAFVSCTAGAALLLAACEPGESRPGDAAASDSPPAYEVDPHWPKPLPDDWILGQVSGVAVDERDHVWIVQRPRTLSAREAGAVQDPPLSICCRPAPPVIEFDPAGDVVGAWGGPGDGYDWPASEHGIHVDHEGNVWIGGNTRSDNFVLKFTRGGEFLLQIGRAGPTAGSNDVSTLGGPAAMAVDRETDELYIADGYWNRRVIVYDAASGEYRRHWGAYGEPPSDEELPDYDPDTEPVRHFRSPVHGVAIARDGLVYIADRANNRIQVFRKDGTYVREAFIAPRTLAMGSVWDLALSRDPEQRWLFVPDGTNQVLWIVDRASLEAVHRIGRGGRYAGQFGWVHNVAPDSRGNLYTAEVETGKRVQRFVRVLR